MQPLKMFHTPALCRIVCIRKWAAGLDLSSFPLLARESVRIIVYLPLDQAPC